MQNLSKMYILLYLEFYAPTFTSAKILRAAELFPSSSETILCTSFLPSDSGHISLAPHHSERPHRNSLYSGRKRQIEGDECVFFAHNTYPPLANQLFPLQITTPSLDANGDQHFLAMNR